MSARGHFAAGASMVVLVFGMGRSGSSALARVLSLCGCGLPGELVGATDANPLGTLGAPEALESNEAFLSAHGASWHDPTLRLQGELASIRELAAAFVDRSRLFFRSQPQTPLLVIKEPRITALL